MTELFKTLYSMFQHGGQTAMLVVVTAGFLYLLRDKVVTAKEHRLETLRLLESFRDALDEKNDQIVDLVEKSTSAIAAVTVASQNLVRLVERWDMYRRGTNEEP